MVVAGKRLLRCAITDLGTPPDTYELDRAADRRTRLRARVRAWAVDGVDIVQLREKRLESGELLDLAELAMQTLNELSAEIPGHRTRLIVNSRADIAAAAGAHGVHLTAQKGELTPDQVRRIFAAAGLPECLVSASCHSVEEIVAGREGGADLLLFGPVFEKRVAGERIAPGAGLDRLREACVLAGKIPVLALGGVSTATVRLCAEVGAAGIAGIRPFAR